MKLSLQNIISLLLLSSALLFAACGNEDNPTESESTSNTKIIKMNLGEQHSKVEDGFYIGSRPYDYLYEDCYGGAYVNEDHTLVVLLTDDTPEIRQRVWDYAEYDGVLIDSCEFSLTELYQAIDTVFSHSAELEKERIFLHSSIVDEKQNRAVITVYNLTKEQEATIRSLVDKDCLILNSTTDQEENWIAKAVREGRVELSQDWTNGLDKEAYFAAPVEVTKSVQLGDFIYTMTAPKTLFRLSDLQNGTEIIEITTTLTYVGEQDSITIAARESPFYAGEIADLHGNSDGGGSYDVGAHHVLYKNEPISFTKTYEAYSKRVSAAGPGVIMALVEFTVLDENEERTDESYNYLLAIPYDVLE